MVDYLKLRVDMSDWHGVRDAAADLEKLEAQLEIVIAPPRRPHESYCRCAECIGDRP